MTRLITRATTPGKPVNSKLDDFNNNTRQLYKKSPPIKHFCNFRCGWCDLIGRDLIEQKYRDFGNILLEDNLGYNFFGKELVK